jgi:hypothetical protein
MKEPLEITIDYCKEDKVLKINFSKRTTWFTLDKESCREFAKELIKIADSL